MNITEAAEQRHADALAKQNPGLITVYLGYDSSGNENVYLTIQDANAGFATGEIVRWESTQVAQAEMIELAFAPKGAR